MKTDFLPETVFQDLLRCLMPENALILRLMADTGMRISDAVCMRNADFFSAPEENGCRIYSYVEQKTHKKRTVCIAKDLAQELGGAGRLRRGTEWVFPGRNPEKHRTRQAVWKDLNRCARLWRVNGQRLRRNLGTHSARKIYAVRLYRKFEKAGADNPMECVRVDLNHKDLAVTFLYAMADIISQRRRVKNDLTVSGL